MIVPLSIFGTATVTLAGKKLEFFNPAVRAFFPPAFCPRVKEFPFTRKVKVKRETFYSNFDRDQLLQKRIKVCKRVEIFLKNVCLGVGGFIEITVAARRGGSK